jgi:hypothetical protein
MLYSKRKTLIKIRHLQITLKYYDEKKVFFLTKFKQRTRPGDTVINILCQQDSLFSEYV